MQSLEQLLQRYGGLVSAKKDCMREIYQQLSARLGEVQKDIRENGQNSIIIYKGAFENNGVTYVLKPRSVEVTKIPWVTPDRVEKHWHNKIPRFIEEHVNIEILPEIVENLSSISAD